MLDITRLRLLRAVVATGSIRTTATQLGYTPSAVSQQLASLQRETGLRLIERVGRGISPTAAGRTLAAEAESLFETLTRIDGVVSDLRAGRMGSLSIGYFASAGTTWLPPIVAALRTEFPDLRLDLRITEFDLGGPEPDIDIFVERAHADHGDGDVRRLIADPYFAVVPEDDPLADKAEVPLAELAGSRWVDNDVKKGPCREVLLDACAEAGFSPEFAVETHDYRTAISFVATGIGITVLPQLGIGTLPDGLVTVPVVAPTPVRRISVAVRPSVAQHPAARRAVELLHRGAARQDTATVS
ncbi:MAG: LysR family transcriptional regulator [Actinophytocola sp.]|nr:LysR family transcriptional regulator [Actinophytocola sp.]